MNSARIRQFLPIAISIILLFSPPLSLAGPFHQIEYSSSADIEIWYGDTQYFGEQGNPQNWLNIQGNISFSGGPVIAQYSLNDATPEPLPLGPDNRRLIGMGDFNIGIDRSELNEGANYINITVTNQSTELANKTVIVNYTSDNIWPFPYSANWDELTNITDVGTVAQVVDGLWELEPEGIRVAQQGYDLTIAIGDETWPTDYEVTVPFTRHSGFSGIGFAFGWQGHTGDRNPPIQWPLQSLAWIRGGRSGDAPTLEIMSYGGPEVWEVVHPDTQEIQIIKNRPYILKARSEFIGNGISRTDVKVWAENESEPDDWMISAETSTRKGSILLVAYNVDVTFGNVTVSSLTEDGVEPIQNISDISDLNELTGNISSGREPSDDLKAWTCSSADGVVLYTFTSDYAEGDDPYAIRKQTGVETTHGTQGIEEQQFTWEALTSDRLILNLSEHCTQADWTNITFSENHESFTAYSSSRGELQCSSLEGMNPPRAGFSGDRD
ncbi:MAG: hypothetical protein V3U76_11820 [Granulosicoccus sp.]